MVATLYKKRPTFNIESVNTDYSSKLPPYFLGIKNAAYVDPLPKESDFQSEIDKLYLIHEKKDAHDEDEDLFNEEYTKHKKLKKALEQQTGQ
mmetsp:Transcript_45824/g.33562  ORF Transcript_45824/g.33562 Transcript_45824/m.33562 type:complete len:92 (+) Transcript_45824:782-1057(+)